MGQHQRVPTRTVVRDQHSAGKIEGAAAPEQNRAPLTFIDLVVGRAVGTRRQHPWSFLSLTRLRRNLYTKMKFSWVLAAPVAVAVVRSNRMSTASRKEDRQERQAAQQPPATGAWKVLLDECQHYMLP